MRPLQATRPARPRSFPRPLAWRIAGLAALLALGACQAGVLHPRGPVGEAQKTILLNSLLIMLAIVVPTILATLGVAWWFRASNPRARYRPDWTYSGRLELVTWSIPVLVVLFLGGITWIGSHDLDPYRPLESDRKPLEIQVVSLDWKWLFLYPDQGVASVNQLVVPTNVPLRFSLTSASVMNAFFVPQLGSMIYTMNGMTTQLNLQADHEGTYEGMSSHFSGDGFPGMRFALKAVGEGEFESWSAAAKSAPEELDAERYAALAKQSANHPPAIFRLADPQLFRSIATQAIPPAPGPEARSPAPAVVPGPTAAICTPALPAGERASSVAGGSRPGG